jgi:hypothetical protein
MVLKETRAFINIGVPEYYGLAQVRVRTLAGVESRV